MTGIEKVLDFAQLQGLLQGILTYNTVPDTVLSLERAGLIQYFSDSTLIVGRDCVQHPKPHPDHITFLLDRMGLTSADVCVIGDHPHDIEAANAVNARSIGITSESHSASEFLTPYICSNLEIETALPIILTEFIGS